MDNVLPEFKRIDASGSKQLSHLHWDTTASLKVPSGDYYRGDGFGGIAEPKLPPKPAPVAPQVVDVSAKLEKGASVPLSDRERGESKASAIERLAKDEVARRPIEAAGVGASLRVFNECDGRGAELYLSRDTNSRGIRIVDLPGGE